MALPFLGEADATFGIAEAMARKETKAQRRLSVILNLPGVSILYSAIGRIQPTTPAGCRDYVETEILVRDARHAEAGLMHVSGHYPAQLLRQQYDEDIYHRNEADQCRTGKSKYFIGHAAPQPWV